ncbi:hypothetical protein [Noviherbaspirillum sp.]|uniref:hypothetical protein n=1 Tax=Noviherbaspirillum sp. TaxID=1926288 RepID=UPI002FE143C0
MSDISMLQATDAGGCMQSRPVLLLDSMFDRQGSAFVPYEESIYRNVNAINPESLF